MATRDEIYELWDGAGATQRRLFLSAFYAAKVGRASSPYRILLGTKKTTVAKLSDAIIELGLDERIVTAEGKKKSLTWWGQKVKTFRELFALEPPASEAAASTAAATVSSSVKKKAKKKTATPGPAKSAAGSSLDPRAGVVRGPAELYNDTQKFRGAWAPVIDRPAFRAFSFLPTPPAQRPRPEKAAKKKKKSKKAEPEPELIEIVEKETFRSPPSEHEVLLNIWDRGNVYRAHITTDGEVYNNQHDIIGYINIEDLEAGSYDEDFLGSCENEEFGDNTATVKDALEEACGSVDLGTCTLRDCAGSTVADIDLRGNVNGHSGLFLGQFEGYKLKRGDLQVVALYLMLIDPGMCTEDDR